MIRRCILFFLVTFLFGGVFSQSLIYYNRLDTKDRTKKQEVKGVEFLAYPLTSDLIDLRDFLQHYPKAQEPDFLKVQLPDMSEYPDSMVLVGYLDEGIGDEGEVVILVVANYNSNEPVIWVDKTMDRSYLNDDDPIELNAQHREVAVKLDPLGKSEKAREFVLYLPPAEKELTEKQLARQEAKALRKKEKEGILKDQFSLGVNVLFGSSKLEYEYLNLNYGFPTWYEVYGTDKGLGVNLTYNLPRFRFGVMASYQNLTYWSSYKFTRYDLPRDQVDPNTGSVTHLENIFVDRNRDVLPQHRMQWSLLVAYRIHLGKKMEIQPRINGGWFTYLPGRYTPEKNKPEQNYAIASTPFIEGGLDFDFHVAPNQAFTIGMTLIDSDFRPTGYFETTPHENLQTELRSWRLSMGYRIGLK